jgi:DNA-binding transcriptional LysR family regulator
MRHQFNWDLIASFLAVIEQGSLQAAGRHLALSQPTVGRHMADLEAQLGAVLFERTGKGLLPTAVARSLLDSARSMQAGAASLARTLSGVDASAAGSVRITASTTVATYLLPPVIAHMRRSLPDIRVELVSSNAISNLLLREADIAVRMVRPEQSSVVAKKIGQISIGAWAHQSYLNRSGHPKELIDLLRHDLIGGDTDESILKGIQIHAPHVTKAIFRLCTDDLVVQWQAARAGVGVGFVADYLGRSEPDMVKLVPALKVPPLPMWLAVHREVRSNLRIRAVYDYLAEYLPVAL